MRRLQFTFISVLIFIVASAFPSFAALNNVTIRFTQDESAVGEPWYAYPSSADWAEITNYECGSETWTAGKAVTFKIYLTPTNGNTFSQSKTNFRCSSSNGTVTSKTVHSDSAVVTVKWTPSLKLAAPEPYLVSDFEAKWPAVKGAGAYEVKLYMDNGEKVSTRTVKTDATVMDLTPYVSNNYELRFEVRAVAPSTQKGYVTASEWALCGEEVTPSEKNTSYGAQLTGAGKNTKMKLPNGSFAKGWQLMNEKWYYFDDATQKATVGWRFINGSWFHFEDDGTMTTGWKLVDGRWYHFITTKDSNEGKMETGWILSQGYWFYLTPVGADGNITVNAGRPVGSMYANEATPDGHFVAADGKMQY